MSPPDHPQRLQPPVPFADFEFAFDPALHNLFPSPPPLPSSADLFTNSETTDLLGFLDNFNWEFDLNDNTSNLNDSAISPHQPHYHHQPTRASPPYSNPHLDIMPQRHCTRSGLSSGGKVTARDSSSPTVSTRTPSTTVDQSEQPHNLRSKPVLSSPQKRLNHIVSEQKRRNAIRDGYVQLTTLLAPAGAPPGTGMPTRGRPKGSGNRGKGRCQGKSGILFRAVEYCHWMEESVEALDREVLRLEAAAGIYAA
jgi:Helix-loop-helix DNA-binding domain